MQQEVLHLNYNEFNELESYEFDEPEEISTVIEGFFQPEDIEKNMAIKKLNFTLCIMLIVLIAITTVSYYFASANEMTLNDLSKETMIYNYENTDLENKLDKLKSFNNVDTHFELLIPLCNAYSVALNLVNVAEFTVWNAAALLYFQ